MDADWALGELRTFVDLTRLGPQPSMAGVAYFGDARSVTGAVDTIIASAQVVEQILDRALPGWRSNVPEDESGRWQRERQAAQRAIVQLEREAEVVPASASRLRSKSPGSSMLFLTQVSAFDAGSHCPGISSTASPGCGSCR